MTSLTTITGEPVNSGTTDGSNMNLQDARTIIRFRLEEHDKLRRPLLELDAAVTAVMMAEETLRNAPTLAKKAKEDHDRVIAAYRTEESEARKRATVAKEEAAAAIEKARKDTALAEQQEKNRRR